jgi:hypothetical protein
MLVVATRNLVVGDCHALTQEGEVVKVGPEKQPLSVRAMLGDDSHAESWRRVLGHLETSTATDWLGTASPNGPPHIRPVLAVWACPTPTDAVHVGFI